MSRCVYKLCSRCKQDTLFVMKRRGTGALYLHCEECEWAWNSPTDVDAVEKGFLGLDLDGEYATRSDVEQAGWLAHGVECHEA